MPSHRLPPVFNVIAGLRWPLPALLAWGAGWLVWALALAAAWPEALGFGTATLVGATLGWVCAGHWRRAIAGLGFPLSAWVLGAAAGLPSWAWLLLLLPVLAAYPLRAWGDAPFFPTPADALAGLEGLVGTPRRVLDAGCGLGHGLAALHRLWPQAELHGLEWSAPLAWVAALRCRPARVWRGDMWAVSWAAYDLVYLFQRPESMARAHAKAVREMAPGACLVSLEFRVPGQEPAASLQGPGRRPLWVYRPLASLPQGAPRSTGATACR